MTTYEEIFAKLCAVRDNYLRDAKEKSTPLPQRDRFQRIGELADILLQEIGSKTVELQNGRVEICFSKEQIRQRLPEPKPSPRTFDNYILTLAYKTEILYSFNGAVIGPRKLRQFM